MAYSAPSHCEPPSPALLSPPEPGPRHSDACPAVSADRHGAMIRESNANEDSRPGRTPFRRRRLPRSHVRTTRRRVRQPPPVPRAPGHGTHPPDLGLGARVVMEILGRSQISITMAVYTHVTQDTQREAISHMDRLLKRRPSTAEVPGLLAWQNSGRSSSGALPLAAGVPWTILSQAGCQDDAERWNPSGSLCGRGWGETWLRMRSLSRNAWTGN